MKIVNVRKYHTDGSFRFGEICTDGDRISDVSTDGIVIDGQGAYLIPGLTDLHFHGCAGADLCDASPESIRKIAAYELSRGVTQISPATVTLPQEELLKIMEAAAAYISELKESELRVEIPDGQRMQGNRKVKESQDNKDHRAMREADLVGIHLEGPFISPEKCGAQNPAYVQEPGKNGEYALDCLKKLKQASGGLLRTVTAAPEIPGICELIAQAAKDEELKSISFSLGHTNADADSTKKAFAAGASRLTHMFNAMPTASHRAPGVIGAAFDTEGIFAELICDGAHVDPIMVRAAFQLMGADRIVMISDSLSLAGSGLERSIMGGLEILVSDGKAILPDGTIAGSVSTLMDCFRTSVLKIGIPLEQAVQAAAVNPVKALGLTDRYGSLEKGKIANMLLMNDELDLTGIVFHGKIVEN